ncbi:MAG: hypothetical protein OEV61_06435 [Chloroflexota bacterium]|jgi:hypothetical protein|nr:hypothetical protein [Chloroflexota bacterium]MDH5242580.1 hypothetical protein [Chloroflexota bacterium]
MRRLRSVGIVVVAGMLLAACNATTPSTGPTAVTGATTAPASVPSVAATSSSAPTLPPSVAETLPPPPEETLTETFPRGAFSDPTTIDNLWLPFKPGTRWIWEGEATIDGFRHARRVELQITDLSKVVDGVQALVAYELDLTDGVLNEAELIFLAQDDEGNIWHLGQYPEEYEDGQFVEAPIWIAGFDDASAGIWMLGEPRHSAVSYAQGYAPSVGWADRARVFETGSVTCVPAGCYEDVLVIDEFSRDEPDAHQLKYYAPGVGGVRVGWAGAREEEREELELVSVETLGPDAKAAIRAAVLAQDARGRDISPDIYGRLPPIEPLPATD